MKNSTRQRNLDQKTEIRVKKNDIEVGVESNSLKREKQPFQQKQKLKQRVEQ